MDAHLDRCAALIASSTGLLITAGAGMGVDSGLPDFRGREGFWKAYPALRHAGIDFTDIANPAAFASRPETAWGFYGHRLALYRRTEPHAGFAILQRIAASMPNGAFVYTSNVDGQFQKAGFDPDRICEVHGSIHWLQCVGPCGEATWAADDLEPVVDEAHCRLTSPLPRCPGCGALLRPNILMFGDMRWLAHETEAQHERLADWRRIAGTIAVIELGAGTAIPTIRRAGDMWGYPLIRVNPREPEVDHPSHIGIAMGALEFLERLEKQLC